MKKIKAFTLIEMAIVLTIVGVLMMAVFKGQQILQNAKIEKTITQIEAIRISIDTFSSTYYQLPGDYNGNAFDLNGNNNGIIEENEDEIFWQHLEQANLIPASLRKPAIGGTFFVTSENGQNYIVLANNKYKHGIVTPNQAAHIKAKIDGNVENAGVVKIANEANSHDCIQNGILSKTNKKCCVIYIEFP